MREVPVYYQNSQNDCGAACIRIIAEYYGLIVKKEIFDSLGEIYSNNPKGLSLLNICDAIESLGMHSLAVKVSYKRLQKQISLPCIALIHKRHYVVVYKIDTKKLYIVDPSRGRIDLSKENFLYQWKENAGKKGVLVLIDPPAGKQISGA